MVADSGHFSFTIAPADAGERLDRFLSLKMPNSSRSQIQQWIADGHVRLNGRTDKASRELKAGQLIEVAVPDLIPDLTTPENISLDILFEDSDILVVNKAPEMVTHPGPGQRHGTLVNALLHYCRDLSGIGGVLRPGIVHRLDKGTSGVLVIAKHDDAHRKLSGQFQDRLVVKTYQAFVWGTPRDLQGVIRSPLGRSQGDRKKISSRTSFAREAVTHYTMQRSWGAISFLELTPKTGRTHQLRVHLSELGHSIVGDPVYGKAHRRFDAFAPSIHQWLAARPYQLLHARSLGFIHPKSGDRLTFEAPLRGEMRALWELLEQSSGSVTRSEKK